MLVKLEDVISLVLYVISVTSSQSSHKFNAVMSSSLEAQCALDQPVSSSTKVGPTPGRNSNT